MACYKYFLNVFNTRFLISLSISCIIVFFDQFTKIAIKNYIQYGKFYLLTNYFNLVLVHNRGAAFSFLATQSGWQCYMFIIISITTSLYILSLLLKCLNYSMLNIGLTFMLGGAISNTIDRIMYSYVIDFIDFHIGNWHWPIFNIADITIFIGTALILFSKPINIKQNM